MQYNQSDADNYTNARLSFFRIYMCISDASELM